MVLFGSQKHLLLLFFLVSGSGAIGQFNEMVHRLQEVEARCDFGVVNRYFRAESILCVVATTLNINLNKETAKNSYDQILTPIMVGLTHNIMIKMVPPKANSTYDFGFEKVHNYIIFVTKTNDVDAILELLTKQTMWNPYGNFLIHIVGMVDDFPMLSTYIFNSFWKFFVINIIIIYPHTPTTKAFIFTWTPFEVEHCGKGQTKVIHISNCSEAGMEPPGVDLFPQQFPSRLNNCPIRAVVRVAAPFVLASYVSANASEGHLLQDGVELTMLKTIANKREFDLRIT